MKNTALVVMVATILAFSMISGLVSPILASGSQSWNLDSHNDHDVLNPAWLCQMEMTDSIPGDDGQSGSIVLGTDQSQIWIADQKATADVLFGGGDGAWVLELVTDTGWETDGSDCIVEIGFWNGVIFQRFYSALQDNPPDVKTINDTSQLVITYVFQAFNAVVQKDRYLAIRVTNLDNQEHTIFCGETEKSSCLTSPGTNPGYPTPNYPPRVPVSSGVGTALMIASFAVLSIIMVRARHSRHERTGK
jgi:hypothetical protein